MIEKIVNWFTRQRVIKHEVEVVIRVERAEPRLDIRELENALSDAIRESLD